jgi:hypothetical protein
MRKIVKVSPKQASSTVTIPVAEYARLQQPAAFVGVLMQSDTYNNAQVIDSIKNAVDAMQRTGQAGADL